MAANMFIEISDIEGDATEDDHKKWIVIEDLTWSVERAVDMSDLGSTQRGHANSNFQRVAVSSYMGMASNKLMLSVANGTIRPEIKIHLCRSGDSAAAGLLAYSIWTLKDVLIDSYELTADAESIPKESWTMAYSAIEHEYKETDQKTGKVKAMGVFKWDVQSGKVE